MKTFITILLLFVASSFAAPLVARDSFTGFRITSPTGTVGPWTDGQCYQVSFEGGESSGLNITSIDLVDANGSTTNQWTGAVPITASGQVPWSLNLPNDKSGSYDLTVLVRTKDGSQSKQFPGAKINGIYNPNSPPSQC
ncbi:hypothetical protein G9A89_000199 [Geosiphon pyriformis]|nr:hypothetical protein G9A89_000199 [Geosiphon pyriformis]